MYKEKGPKTPTSTGHLPGNAHTHLDGGPGNAHSHLGGGPCNAHTHLGGGAGNVHYHLDGGPAGPQQTRKACAAEGCLDDSLPEGGDLLGPVCCADIRHALRLCMPEHAHTGEQLRKCVLTKVRVHIPASVPGWPADCAHDLPALLLRAGFRCLWVGRVMHTCIQVFARGEGGVPVLAGVGLGCTSGPTRVCKRRGQACTSKPGQGRLSARSST